MSHEEELMVMGRVLMEYTQVRRQLILLRAEADRWGHEVQTITRYLVPQQCSKADIRQGGEPPDLKNFPTAEQLSTLFGEVQMAMRRKQELRELLKGLGAEPVE